MMRRGIGALAFAIAFAIAVAAPSTAFADAKECSAAAEDGQQLRAKGRWLAARAKFLECSATTCPSVVKADCARWAQELTDALPTIVVEARDGSGKDLMNVKVFADDTLLASQLDGRGIPIDPGPHKLRFETEGRAPITQDIIASENAKGRRIPVSFGAGPTSASTAGTAGDDEPRKHTIYPWILVGAGVITAGVGGALIAVTPAYPPNCDKANDTCERRSPTQSAADYKEDQDQAGRAKNYPTYGLILIGVGAAVIAGGFIWHFLEPTGTTKQSARIRFTLDGVAGTF